MSTHLSRYFRQRRESARIPLGNLARRCGYKNVSKGANRIQKFEDRGEFEPILFRKLAAVLGMTQAEIEQCVAQDRADWERWADEPIEPHLVVRLIPGVYSRKSIPVDLRADRAAMEGFAATFAAEKRMKVWLVVSRRLRVWFDEDGAITKANEDTFEQSHGPFMLLGGKWFLFDFMDEGGATITGVERR